MKIKKGSIVQIISGKYKNQSGKILSICKESNKVIVENINIKIKHVKPKQDNEKGNIKQIEAPIHFSNIKIEKDKK
uniref:Large ribosomal subunit protein uL24c n=1 Tax=Polysiphonia sertularioides TaxID=945028 RepID=A0A1Z1M977_9FLOR|nr:ribosomal protein L24 [Polysiphonia sertularioides]ARW62536.1 ribosomal protein L24 [Polysiphonia sertularioides]